MKSDVYSASNFAAGQQMINERRDGIYIINYPDQREAFIARYSFGETHHPERQIMWQITLCRDNSKEYYFTQRAEPNRNNLRVSCDKFYYEMKQQFPRDLLWLLFHPELPGEEYNG